MTNDLAQTTLTPYDSAEVDITYQEIKELEMYEKTQAIKKRLAALAALQIELRRKIKKLGKRIKHLPWAPVGSAGRKAWTEDIAAIETLGNTQCQRQMNRFLISALHSLYSELRGRPDCHQYLGEEDFQRRWELKKLRKEYSVYQEGDRVKV
jgi:hypothetical protein